MKDFYEIYYKMLLKGIKTGNDKCRDRDISNVLGKKD